MFSEKFYLLNVMVGNSGPKGSVEASLIHRLTFNPPYYTMESMKVTPKFNRRVEGIRELASMIADAYKKGKTYHNDDEEPLVSEGEIIVGRESDGENGYKYRETVCIDNKVVT